MPVGSGLSASFGIATETTFAVPVPATRFYEFDSESLSMKKHTAQGLGLRQGALTKLGRRRILAGYEAAGDVNMDVTTNGFGLLLSHMLGSVPAGGTLTPTALTGAKAGFYQQVHNPGVLTGRSFTTQIVDPDTTGVLGNEAFTYPGCKITDWELSIAAGAQAKLKVTIDANMEATPANSFAATTLSSTVSQGATSITTVAALPVNTNVLLDNGANGEIVTTTATAPTGTGPYTSTLVTPTKVPHASGVYVGPPTVINYGAATAFQVASYNTSSYLFSFTGAAVIVGGTTVTTGGIFTNTGGTQVGSVRNFTITGKNPQAQDRWQLGYLTRSEPIGNNWRDYTASVEVDYNGRAFYDAYAAEAPLAFQVNLATPSGASLSLYAPYAMQNDGASPEVSGPGVVTQKLALEFLDDGINGALQAVYTSTDSSL